MVSKKTVFFSFATTFVAIFIKNYLSFNFSQTLNIEQLIRSFGYQTEIHQIFTDDGYVLRLHRILSNHTTNHRIPIVFMHGLLNSAAEFVNLGPGKALSLLLSDRGYDVWLVNSRGTTWSRTHKTLNPDNHSEYWDFSLHEVGVYDLPKIIDYVLDITKKKFLHYIGYSQGCAAFFIMASELPEYSRKVRLMTAVAPAVYINDPRSPLLQFCVKARRLYEVLFNIFNINEIFAKGGFVDFYLKGICQHDSILFHLCLHQFFIIHGYSEEQIDKTIFPTILSSLPAGTSSKHIRYTLQLMNSGRFEKFDYGADQNRQLYGNSTPPLYDLKKVQTPVAIYYTSNDWIILTQNVEKLSKRLPNVVKLYQVPSDSFNHHDFLHAKDVVPLVYNSIIEEILKY